MEVTYRFPDCDLGEGILRRVGALPVHYRVLGQTRAPYVEFEREVPTVKAGGGCDAAFPSGAPTCG